MSDILVMTPGWHHLLFLHWPVPAEQLRPLLPPGLELDLFHGQAYVGLIPFTMTNVRPPWAPPLGRFDDFHETNVRTYVRRAGKFPGVWFFSLDAANPLAVVAARASYYLPYFFARMHLRVQRSGGGNPTISYRTCRGWPAPLPAHCAVRYTVHGDVAAAPPGSLEHFLVERYILYSHARGKLFQGRVQHAPYPLQTAKIHSLQESMLAAAGIRRPPIDPIVHYARVVQTKIYALEPVE